MSTLDDMVTKKSADELNKHCENKLPGYLGIEVVQISNDGLLAQLAIKEHHMAPNGFLHAGAVVTLADTACGNGCMAFLPQGACGFTTIELKSNHLGTATEGSLECLARPLHQGRTTQVWDATVKHKETNKVIALFRCTQLIIYPK